MRVMTALALVIIASGCSTPGKPVEWRGAGVYTSPESCSTQLSRNRPWQHAKLDSRDIQVVNWNIQKGGDPDWVEDLSSFVDEPDLMILQEAALQTDAWALVADAHHQSFTPGWRTFGNPGTQTGVMTLSTVEPMTSCGLISYEPWLRSPKATTITEYALTDSEESLVVVNIHAINFTFGNSDFREQVRRALAAIQEHEGPILLSGDFNTWHWRQSIILHDMASDHGLVNLEYDEDHRKRVFGQPLDHIYVRGLRVISATSTRVDSSDHNPMSARLSL